MGIKGYRVMLIPNNKQRTRLFQFAGAARFAYNWALSRQMDNFRNGRKHQSESELRKEFTQMRHAPETAWLENISNNVTKQAIKDCCNAYQRFFKIQRTTKRKFTKKKLKHLQRIKRKPTVYDMNGHPKFKSRKCGNCSFYQDPVKIQFTETHVKLEGLAVSRKGNRGQLNWIRLAEHKRIPADAKYVNPRVTFDGLNWWVSVGGEEQSNAIPEDVKTEGLGIDLGLKDLAIASDKTKVESIAKSREYRRIKKRRRRLQRQISRKYKKGGSRYRKTQNIVKSERKLLKLNRRLTNLRHNHIHQVTTGIVERNPSFICLEDLNVQGMMANKYLAESVQDQGLYEFRRQIEYKAERAGIPVIIASRWYPGSKTCNRCGYIKKNLKLKERTYRCPECGLVIDRDYNAALNLRDYGAKTLSA